jgi:trimeric autotransporter adhesin
MRYLMRVPECNDGRILPLLALWSVILLGTGSAHGQMPAGQVVAWGDNFWGQTNIPASATNVVAISARGDLNIALKADGQVLVWPQIFVGPSPIANSMAVAAGGASGGGHCVALRADGRVFAWGASDAGQTNVPVAGLSNVTAIAAGVYHNLAVRDGFVFGWGDTTWGKVPVAGTINGVRTVAAGLDHSVALRTNGTVIVWGRNNLNQLAVPVDAVGVIAIAAGANHTLALRSDGRVRAWGANNAGQLNLANGLTGVRSIGAGDDHSLAVLSNGTVVVWGNNSVGQTNIPAGLSNIVAVSGGASHSVALRLEPVVITTQPASQSVLPGATVMFNVVATGSQPMAYQWRKNGTPINNATNTSFSLFNVTTNDIAAYSVVVSNPLTSLTSSDAILQVNVPAFITQQPQSQDAGVGSTATFRVTAGGTGPISYQWRRNGTNVFGFSATYSIFNVQPANAGNYTVLVSNNFGAVTSAVAVLAVHTGPAITQQPQSQTVIAGASVTFTVVASNAAGYEWRKNGAPISNATNSFYSIASVQSSDAANYSVRVTNQFGSTLSDDAALTVTSAPAGSTRVIGWGEQLVWNGSAWIDVSPPASLGTVTAVAVGGAHSLALRADGTVAGWGDNTYGQAGAPSNATNVIAIAAGLHHSLALRSDGRVVAWGRGDNWQQTAVPAHSNVIAIAAGANHSLAVQSNGVVIGWGRNDDGRATPHPNLGVARNVGAGSDHSLGVRTNTTVRAWGGQNLHGETLAPATLSNVLAVAGGTFHSLALRSNGSVVAWGDNAFGQTNVPAFRAPVKAIASGAHHCLALLQDGSVLAWGNGNNEQTNTPSLSGVIAIAAGANRSLAVKPRQLLLQRPARLADGRYRLTLSNDDGLPATPEQLARVQVFASSNLVAGASSWIQLTNPMSISSGSIRLDDSPTNLLRRFFRARENP